MTDRLTPELLDQIEASLPAECYPDVHALLAAVRRVEALLNSINPHVWNNVSGDQLREALYGGGE